MNRHQWHAWARLLVVSAFTVGVIVGWVVS